MPVWRRLPSKRIEDVLWTFRDRILDLKKDRRFKYILIFKNHGEAAGASLEHAHSQLIALPILPINVVQELEGAKQYFLYKERCVFCDIIRQEMDSGTRVVGGEREFPDAGAVCSALSVRDLDSAQAHESAFENSSSHMFENLARALKDLLGRADRVLDNPPYNLVIHTSPVQDPTNDHYHWHIEFMPKLTKTAGFEWGTGFYINPTPPGRSGEVSARGECGRACAGCRSAEAGLQICKKEGHGTGRALLQLWPEREGTIEGPNACETGKRTRAAGCHRRCKSLGESRSGCSGLTASASPIPDYQNFRGLSMRRCLLVFLLVLLSLRLRFHPR